MKKRLYGMIKIALLRLQFDRISHHFVSIAIATPTPIPIAIATPTPITDEGYFCNKTFFPAKKNKRC